jgi:hypothetical protein
MSRLKCIYQWSAELKQNLRALTAPQAMELAFWSVGLFLARRATLSGVTVYLSAWLSSPYNTVRQRLRDWYLPRENKCGCQRRASVDPERCFGDLLRWVLRLLPDQWDHPDDPDRTGPPITLALDASNLKDRLVVLCVSVLIAGSGIPVAWRIVRLDHKEAWQRHWLELLDRISPALDQSSDRFVVVLADRGLWAPWLFEAICKKGWHPLMRINGGKINEVNKVGDADDIKTAGNPAGQGQFRVMGRSGMSGRSGRSWQPWLPWQPISSYAPRQRDHEVCLSGEAFKGSPLRCMLIAFWGEKSIEPWYLLTDCANHNPDNPMEGRWYGMRMWIEHQFKEIKSDGWDWERSRILAPDRVQRMWLVYAVSLLWAQTFGSDAERQEHQDCEERDEKSAFTAGALEAPEPDATGDSQSIPSRESHSPEPQETRPRKLHRLCPIPDNRKPRQPSWHARQTSLFLRGAAILVARFYHGLSLTCPKFAPYGWPHAAQASNTS